MATFGVERSALIDAPAEKIYPLIENFHEWVKWSPWETIDPTMQRSYAGPDSGVGAKYAWKGNKKAGQGTMEITAANPVRSVAIRLEFSKPMKALNPTTFVLTPEGAGTRVIWSMTGESKGISRLFMVFINMDKMVGGDFEKGLAKLATVVQES